MFPFDIHWQTVWSNLILMGAAYALALPIGWNRELHDRSAGLRTFPLVALATCGFMLVGMDVLEGSAAQSRTLEGIITGMGFIGGGAILKQSRRVSGTATAASLWSTGAIGIAVAWQRLEIAISIALMTFATLQLVPSVKAKLETDEHDADRE
ncbi:MAG: MgtC/SapB family protein [Xanthomonadales bacterium]|nr:MgtC/SapB family protein [Xanthomonadales bacterium]